MLIYALFFFENRLRKVEIFEVKQENVFIIVLNSKNCSRTLRIRKNKLNYHKTTLKDGKKN